MISEYLQKKYGFTMDASIHTTAIASELLISEEEALIVARDTLKKRNRQTQLLFSEFCEVVEANI